VQALASQVSFPGSPSYVATKQSYWSLQEASLDPACIVKPQSAQDVSKAMSVLASDGNCKFAIKSQGHAPAAGFANIQDGVTIDLTALRSVSLSSNKKVAYVGAGASWLDVYTYLDQHNVTVAGGRNGQVGVGGLTLGGGISYIGPRVGWACDNVLNFEVRTIPRCEDGRLMFDRSFLLRARL
jgi:FAD/FMN-containing dehydrogenase